MTIADIVRILQADLVCGADHLETEVHNACGSDMMSDVLAFVKDQSVLLTRLVNPQVVRTADIPLLVTKHRMFTACGLLYENGLKGGEV